MTLPLTASTVAYEARYRWTAKNVYLALLSSTPLLLVLFGKLSPVLQVLFVVLGVFSLGLQVLIASSGKTALRVDDAGVLLGGSPIRYDAFTALVPWSDIVAVELWVQRPVPWQKQYFVGLHRVPGAPELPGNRTGRMAQASQSLTGKTPELLSASRAAMGWKLDGQAFLDAVQQLAPQVEIRVEPGFKL